MHGNGLGLSARYTTVHTTGYKYYLLYPNILKYIHNLVSVATPGISEMAVMMAAAARWLGMNPDKGGWELERFGHIT